MQTKKLLRQRHIEAFCSVELKRKKDLRVTTLIANAETQIILFYLNECVSVFMYVFDKINLFSLNFSLFYNSGRQSLIQVEYAFIVLRNLGCALHRQVSRRLASKVLTKQSE